MPRYIIAPSLLSADFARLGEEAQSVLDAGADMLHLDVMDNHYVPNLTVGPLVCKALRNYGITAPIDVHLMVTPVDRMINDFAKAGASHITFHPEATQDVNGSLALIKQHGIKAGLALNPETSIDVLNKFWDQLDLILMMSVNPGFGGQSFIPSVLDKMKKVRALINEKNPTILLAVDGGIKRDNIREVRDAGANMFIAGSAVYSEPDYKKVIDAMRKELGATS